RRRGREEMSVNWGMNDFCLSAVVGANAVPDESRVGDEVIDAVRPFTIPSLQTWLDHPHDTTLKRAKSIVIPGVPDVSHWSMAITDVSGESCKNALGYCGARGDHEVEPAQIPRPDRSRKQRQKISIVTVNAGYLVQPRSADPMGFDVRRNF